MRGCFEGVNGFQDQGLEELLKQQRAMVQLCMDNAQKCMEMNEAISQKLSRDTKPKANGRVSFSDEKGGALAALQEPLMEKRMVSQVSGGSDMGEKGKRETMFGSNPRPQPMTMRDRVIEALKKKTYNVEDFYKKEGLAQSWARWDVFQNTVLGVIALNSLWIAYETDNNKATIITQAEPIFQIGDNFFTLFFLFEICVRFAAFEEKKWAFQDGWFCFDLTLVSLMVLETYIEPIIAALMGSAASGLNHLTIFRLFRLFRLARVGRLIRLLRAFPELLVLTKAMFYALRSLGATCSLLCLTLYVFSIMFTQLLAGTETGAGYFDTVPQSFDTLLMTGVFTEQKEMIEHMLDGSIVYYFLMIGYLMVASYTVLNMLIGVICEVIAEVASREKEDILLQDLKAKIATVARTVAPDSFTDDMDITDMDAEIMVSPDIFHDILNNQEACQALDEVGVDVASLAELSTFFFPKNRKIELTEFLQLILQFRGSNTATVKDIVDMRRFMVEDLKNLSKQQGRQIS